MATLTFLGKVAVRHGVLHCVSESLFQKVQCALLKVPGPPVVGPRVDGPDSCASQEMATLTLAALEVARGPSVHAAQQPKHWYKIDLHRLCGLCNERPG